MSKRKVVAGGYEESSDGIEIDPSAGFELSLKRSKSTPYAPPRLTVQSKSVAGAFRLPGSAASSMRGSVPPLSSRRSTPASDSIQTARSTPEIQTSRDSEPRSGTPFESSGARSLGSKDTAKSSHDPPFLHKFSNARSTLALERQLNYMTDAFDGYKNISDERHRLTDEKLNRILEAVTCWAPANNLAPQAQDLTTTTTPFDSTKPYLSNPSPTPELIAIVSKVVSEARSRIGKKKGGADDNSFKEHARSTFYRMLGITAAREIRPFFEDRYGEPDTLPAQFMDPDTKYCRPYPHWKAPLTRQV
ncbi:hypothetical protein FRC06_010793, partial [Ceratobasidium sp. 370]